MFLKIITIETTTARTNKLSQSWAKFVKHIFSDP